MARIITIAALLASTASAAGAPTEKNIHRSRSDSPRFQAPPTPRFTGLFSTSKENAGAVVSATWSRHAVLIL
jgi:hypothetical protein